MKQIALLLVLGVGTAALAQDAEPQAKPATAANKKAVSTALGEKTQEIDALRTKAKTVTEKIGELATSGKIPTTDDAVATLKELVQELANINEQLKKLQEDVEGIKGWIEGQTEALPIMAFDIDQLKRVSWGNYVQFQWTDTQERYPGQTGTRNDGFNLRRVRLSTTNNIDSKTQARISLDLAAGSQRLGAELKDAFLTYNIEPSETEVGTSVAGGQMALPLGYELERSSGEREFPERAVYNRTMFGGERGRGVNVRYGIGNGAFVHAGAWNSLTVGDPQQTAANTFRNLNGTTVAFTGGIRHASTKHDVGISAFLGERPRFSGGPTNGVVTADKGDRRFIYMDGTYVGLLVPQLSFRGELMTGRDRLPAVNSNGTPRSTEFTDMLGWQAQLTYNINYRNQIAVRYEFFDPNTDSSGRRDTTKGMGISYLHYLNPGARLMIAHERYDENPREVRDNVTTIRMQFRM